MELLDNALQTGGIQLRTQALRFVVDVKHLETEVFENDDVMIMVQFTA